MFDSTRSIELIVAYLEAVGVASGARTRRRALQMLNECRSRAEGDGEISDAALLRLVREQVLVAASLSERALPPETPARMPPQAFRRAAWRRRVEEAPHEHAARAAGDGRLAKAARS